MQPSSQPRSVTFQGQTVPEALILSEEQRNTLKEKLLTLIQKPDAVILTQQSYDQLALVVAICIKYDFPAQWPQLN